MAKKPGNAAVCINGPEPFTSAQDERVWDQAGWSAFIDDVDLMIENRRGDIKTLLHSRKIAQRNLEAFKPYPRRLQEKNTEVFNKEASYRRKRIASR